MTIQSRQQAQARFASFMDPLELERVERIKVMNSRHISSARDAQLKTYYQRLIRNTQTENSKLAGLVILGSSGSGKTHLVRSMENMPGFQPYRVPEEPDFEMLPYISVDAPPKAAPNYILWEIAKACGSVMEKPGNVPEMIEHLTRWFEKRRVLFVHVDEFQHALRTGTEKQIKEIQDTIKELIQIDAKWPVQVILSGTRDLLAFRESNDELRTRTMPFDLESLLPENDLPVVMAIADGIITQHAGLEHSELIDEDFAHKLLKAANYQFGSVIQFTRLACEEVILEGGTNVTIDHFAAVYNLLVGDRGENFNMFNSLGWRELRIPRGIVEGTAFTDIAKKRKKTSKVR
ncbi:ATP-binding protein [Rhizobium sp. LjRoot98]|uniref:ATP-binding protein n=1 Tax=Rhizobium sp. LjRoot98 TaxID=3342345 RepID=UPI003ECC4150